ncbi:MAG: BTAD domain-containing putative transcriptional regulator [Thermoleophilia bacterium]
MTTATRGAPESAASLGVLRTRLLPPRLPPNTVGRPELVSRVRRGVEGRLLAIVAGAGYGKTTLLVQALEGAQMPWAWVSCDSRLGTPEMLIAHVAAGIAGVFPGVATRLAPGGPPERQIAALANELVETVPDEFVLAFDDVHALADEPYAVLAQLASDLPPNVHLAVTSRRELGITSSKVAAGGATVVGEDLLAFSFAEAAELLEDLPGEMGEEQVGELHQRTEGWVAGLLLATRSGVAGAGARAATAGPHFDYLADEVLSGLPPDLQGFLLDTAVLERFTPGLAAATSGRPEAPDLIRGLVAAHLFIVQAEGDWYRYHHLFHAFLRRRLEERLPDRLAELHVRAGRAWLDAGDHQEAVRHLLEAGAVEEATAALEPVAEAMVPTPDRMTLAAWLRAIPQETWRSRPGVELAYALLVYLNGDWEGAFRAWAEAIERLASRGELERAAAAIYRSQQAMLTAGIAPEARVAAAHPYLERLAEAGPAGAMAQMIVGVAHAVAGDRDEAERIMQSSLAAAGRRELALLAPCAEMVRGFYFDYPQGRIAQGLRRIDQGLARLEPIEAQESFMLQAFGRGFRAAVLAETGRYRDCLAEAQIVLDLSESVGLRSAPGLLNLWWRVTSLAGLDEWDAVAALEPEARRVMAGGEGTNMMYRLGAGMARLAAARGDVSGALAEIAAARAAAREYGDSYEIPTVLCEMALAAAAAGRPELAGEIAEEAYAEAARLDVDCFRARAAMLSAHAHDGRPPAAERLDEALALTERLDIDLLWTARERQAAGVLLARALAGGGERAPTARRLAVAAGREVLHRCAELLDGAPRARAALADAIDDDTDVAPATMELLLADDDPEVAAAAERARRVLERRPRPPLRIETFGGLRLFRAGVRVPDGAFGRAKARALLGALTCAGDRGVHRDRLLEHLWPELPPDRGARALDTTLHELRRTLEPLAPPRSGGSLILREGEIYRLALGERDSWDAGEFLRLARGDGATPDDTALARMLRAESLWQGSFLPDFPYEPWCEDARRELERERIGLLERLGATLAELGRPNAAIERYRHLLEIDGEREGWHRALMRAYDQAGERALALRQFHACRATLRTRLGIEPSRETRELYTSLL